MQNKPNYIKDNSQRQDTCELVVVERVRLNAFLSNKRMYRLLF